eukprot:CAMPEP_0116560462 /NCGR_PEP_ID=MMETSP0397-20121206/11004_1 /TAXON_ID=216820 /ORGANISM="Cyclophora tenuis, Strain ECT3854" /LENGTH=149 /DNA_ID=CAMNT_0004086423 /DNA_START=150 /DNA_END=599 /DNA_ORIENTATION=-
MKATTSNALTDSRPTVEDQQQLYERLVDSLEAMEEVKCLTEDLGEFVVASRIRATRSRPGGNNDTERPRKRKRTQDPTSSDDSDSSDDDDDDEEEEEASTCRSEQSAKRMMMLYQHLRKTQILFQAEIAKFIQETEKECQTDSAPVCAE